MAEDKAHSLLPEEASAIFEMMVRQRRDVRHFRTDPLHDDDLAYLLEMANSAPSVGLSQPWRFVRILSATLRERLACHVDAQKTQAGSQYVGEQKKLYGRLKLHGLREAPVILAAFCEESTDKGQKLGAATMPETRRYSCVMAIHTMWLAAQAQGLGMGWVSILDPEFVRRELDVPEMWSLLGLLCLGRPAEQHDRPELERLGWERSAGFRQHVQYR